MGIDFQDEDEIVVKVDGSIPVAADYTVAEANALNLTAGVPLYNCREIDVFIDLSLIDPATTEIRLKVRFSGHPEPVIGTIDDWGYIKVDNIDVATGFSTVRDYEIIIPGPTVGRELVRITQTSGTWVSVVIWVPTGALTTGAVSFVRQGGT